MFKRIILNYTKEEKAVQPPHKHAPCPGEPGSVLCQVIFFLHLTYFKPETLPSITNFFQPDVDSLDYKSI